MFKRTPDRSVDSATDRQCTRMDLQTNKSCVWCVWCAHPNSWLQTIWRLYICFHGIHMLPTQSRTRNTASFLSFQRWDRVERILNSTVRVFLHAYTCTHVIVCVSFFPPTPHKTMQCEVVSSNIYSQNSQNQSHSGDRDCAQSCATVRA